jgi:thiamine-monophosphate kinase
MIVADLSERELIARIQSKLPPAPPWLLVGIGDDAAVVEPERNRVEVLTTDTLVEGVHFLPDMGAATGYRALAVNLSDLAAMGATPRLALLSFCLCPSLSLGMFDLIVDGFLELARKQGIHVVGGNLSRTPGPLTIDVTVIGTVKRRQSLTRSGAQPGDELYVSGALGSGAAGLRAVMMIGAERRDPDDKQTVPSVEALNRYLRPEPRVKLGILLGRNRAATACIDLSDGLADGVHRIAEASNVGITVDGNAVPIASDVRDYFSSSGVDPLTEAMTASDDYELLFTVRPRTERRLKVAARHGGVPITRIGVCTEDRAVVVECGGVRSPMPSGYSHFRERK